MMMEDNGDAERNRSLCSERFIFFHFWR